MKKLVILLLLAILILPVAYALQNARPDQDVNAGTYTVTPLWSKLNEAVRNDAEGSYINSSTVSGTLATNISLTSITDPVSSTGHIIRSVARAKTISTSSPQNITYTITLFQGATNIASFSHTKVNMSFYQYNDTLSASQANSISDYSNLTLEFKVSIGAAGIPRKKLGISWATLETPDIPNPLYIWFFRGSAIFILRGASIIMFRG